MGFTDLPSDWPRRSLGDGRLAHDVLDLFVAERQREGTGLVLLATHRCGRLRQPIFAPGLDPWADLRAGCAALVDAMQLVPDAHGLVLAIARPVGVVTRTDLAWAAKAVRVAGDHGVPVWGVHVMTRAMIVRLVVPGTGAERNPAEWQDSTVALGTGHP